MSTVILVDENDNVIGHKKRSERTSMDIIRATGLWVFKAETREVLLAKRSMKKPYDKGKWGPSAAGTLEFGETYESNVVKEAWEEIGLQIDSSRLILGQHRLFKATQVYFYQGFFYEVPKKMSAEDFILEKNEVDEVRFIGISDLVQEIKRKPGDFIESFSAKITTIEDIAAYLLK